MLADVGTGLRAVVGIALCAVVLASLIRRLNEAGPAQRRALEPFALYGAFAVFAIPILSNLLAAPLGMSDTAVRAVQVIVLAGLPFAAIATMLRGGFARMMAIEELASDLGELGELTGLAATLARTLGDESAAVAFEVEPGRLVDGAGEPAASPAPGVAGRGACSVELAGEAKAWIFYDSRLIADAAEVEAVGKVLAIWFEREWLNVTLRASQLDLRRSRREIAGAADAERRRIARDLHDGLASRLVLTAIKVQRIGTAGDREEARRHIDDAHRDLELAIRELRELVQGLIPSGLIEGGLVAAVHDLADGLGSGARVVIEDDFLRPPPEIESTAYFVVAEAVANAVRHSNAGRIEIYLSGTERRLELRVSDDGEGGAAEADGRADGGGSGIRGMRQRVETFEGEFGLSSVPGAGTVVQASLPPRPAGPIEQAQPEPGSAAAR